MVFSMHVTKLTGITGLVLALALGLVVKNKPALAHGDFAVQREIVAMLGFLLHIPRNVATNARQVDVFPSPAVHHSGPFGGQPHDALCSDFRTFGSPIGSGSFSGIGGGSLARIFSSIRRALSASCGFPLSTIRRSFSIFEDTVIRPRSGSCFHGMH